MTYATSGVQIQSSDGMYMLRPICKAQPHTRVQKNVIRSIQPKVLVIHYKNVKELQSDEWKLSQ